MKKIVLFLVVLLFGSLIFVTLKDTYHSEKVDNQQINTENTEEVFPVEESVWSPSPNIDPNAQSTGDGNVSGNIKSGNPATSNNSTGGSASGTSSNSEEIVKEIADDYLKSIPHTEHESFNNFAGVTKNSDYSFNDFTFKEVKLEALKENQKYEKYNVYLVRYTFKLNESLSPDLYFEVSNKKNPKEYKIEGIGTN